MAKKLKERHPELPDSSFALGDYLEASTLPPALKGVDIVFHNGPAFHALESAMGITLINAAKQAGVKHFVYCSVLFPVLTKLVNHKAKFLYVSGSNAVLHGCVGTHVDSQGGRAPRGIRPRFHHFAGASLLCTGVGWYLRTWCSRRASCRTSA